ncbi:MAG: DNA mismatch repair protein MutS [Nitrospina sp.]|jgi:DNA mismatch repair protein MutS|nr:DNA mismatch repair protein MutS [Nitrospina sp.]MBT3508118.1 DNA mismatch repair protein MutS [Nitrospina sp.]MBT3876300.1 DNA mismatch repair protein MutS [Nitrospina sp.]MBT4049984.1 DNA mismatch repair protein MutS [Nitrospina sp.]MBT4556616.1 DNA mismatch repair protein MutS [Nitrospina sp.]
MGVLAKSIKVTQDTSPMMQQYQGIKKEYSDSILFFRMGDFYEMFNEDAKTASSILQIALTARNKKSNPVPMCGIPHHSANQYITKLLKAGKKVAICEQTEDPKFAKGLVKREVVRVITPGTTLDDNNLDPKCDQFIASLYFGKSEIGLSVLDLSTGIFKVTQIEGDNALSVLGDELQKLDPREIIIPETLKDEPRPWLPTGEVFVHTWDDWSFSFSEAYRNLVEHFKTQSLEGFGCENMKAAISSAGALIHYLREIQKSSLEHITALTPFPTHSYMALDQCTLTSLELVQSSEGTRKNSLLDLLDLSLTPMGARRIREWILKPLINPEKIQERLSIVKCFKDNPTRRKELRDLLKHIFDLERLLGRITLSACSARDLVALKSSLKVFPNLQDALKVYKSSPVQTYLENWDNLENIYDLIDRNIVDDPPLGLKEGNLIKPGCNEELDRLNNITREGKNWIAALEQEEKEKTGIPVLKVGFNRIYGYYIEVTKKNIDRVPAEYIRKQSLVNAERYISPKLKEYEEEITGAEEKIFALEQNLFEEIRSTVSLAGSRIQMMARIISEVDALSSFAETAHRYNYCQPEFTQDRNLIIENGRHPLIERIDPTIRFISNDTFLDSVEQQIIIITGPNMAGKSTYLRQVALIVLMAQIGSFVPADKTSLGITDRIFSRVGAQDHLLKGQSTFMVEMNETANILNNATPDSLIILDEIGRGTSTFDGISIAWAIVEYLHKADQGGGPKTLFATHYHELTDLSRVLPGVKNFNVQVKEWNDEIIFLRKIVPGGTDKSYGIQVARLAGLPKDVLDRAHEVLFNLEQSEFDEVGVPKISHSENSDNKSSAGQLALFSEPENPLIQKIKEIDPNQLSPREALEILFELTERLKDGPK